MKRPVGVFLVCLVLGGFAALQVLGAALYAVLGFMTRHSLQAGVARQPGMPAAFSGPMFLALMAGVALFLAGLAGWAIATIVGLVRLRSWARYSALVIGGCLAALGIFGAISTVIMSVAIGQMPNMSTAQVHAIVLVIGSIYAIVGGVGVWWLVYFNLRSTKSIFLADDATGRYEPHYGASGQRLYRPTGRFAHVPTVIFVFACLFLLGAVSCVAMAFLPIPAFLFGFFLGRPAAIVMYLSFAIVSTWIGVGLLRLDNRARLATYAMMGFGAINFLVILTPWGRGRYLLYQAAINQQMHSGITMLQPNPFAGSGMLVLMIVSCFLVYGVQVWALSRYRSAFLAAPPPPRVSGMST